jgi:hypothetical protein
LARGGADEDKAEMILKLVGEFFHVVSLLMAGLQSGHSGYSDACRFTM